MQEWFLLGCLITTTVNFQNSNILPGLICTAAYASTTVNPPANKRPYYVVFFLSAFRFYRENAYNIIRGCTYQIYLKVAWNLAYGPWDGSRDFTVGLVSERVSLY